MKKSLIGIVFGFIIISVLALNVNAQMCGCMGGSGGGMKSGKMDGQTMDMMHGMGVMHENGMMMDDDHPMWKRLMGLGLDEKQNEALMALRSKTMKDLAKKRADKQIAGIELKDLLDKEPVDMKAVEASVKKSESLRAEIFLAHIRAREEMKSILTPDQRKRFKEKTEQGHGAGCGMMGGAAEHMEHMH